MVLISELATKYKLAHSAIKNLLKDIPSMQGKGRNNQEISSYKLEDTTSQIERFPALPQVDQETGIIEKQQL